MAGKGDIYCLQVHSQLGRKWPKIAVDGGRLFTPAHHPNNDNGPEGNRDYRAKVEPEAERRYVGIGTMSFEGTSEASYIWRAAPKTPFPTMKSSNIGKIGWAVPEYQDWSYANTCRQIMLGQFRQEVEDRHFHKYQNPWYPGPLDTMVPGTDAAMVMNVYKSHNAWPMSRQERVQSEDMSLLREPDMEPGQRTLSYLHGGV